MTRVITEPGRLDISVAALGTGRGAAKELILSGAVAVNGKAALKPSSRVNPGDVLTIAADPRPFVSRGGIKLAAALDAFGVDVAGAVCLDVGASTGGFTHCLLSRGAALVYAVDTGTDQLAPEIRGDSRVVSMERTNINDVDSLPSVPRFASVDVSFVSSLKIMRAVFSLISEDGSAVFLIKPQFEAGRDAIGKRGVVKDKKAHLRVLGQIYDGAAELNRPPAGVIRSPITGGGGNVEYLTYFSKQEGAERAAFMIMCEKAVFHD